MVTQVAGETMKRLGFGCLIFAALASTANAADVFVSFDPKGNAHYATQQLDPTYRHLLSDSQISATPRTRIKSPDLLPTIDRIAQRRGLPRDLVIAVASVESNFNADAVSPKGARGAMQLMPQTAARYGVPSSQLLDAERNIDAGAQHLKALLAQYRGNVVLALAAYNAGSGAVNRYGARVPPYQETMLYVPAVLAKSVAYTQAAEGDKQ